MRDYFNEIIAYNRNSICWWWHRRDRRDRRWLWLSGPSHSVALHSDCLDHGPCHSGPSLSISNIWIQVRTGMYRYVLFYSTYRYVLLEICAWRYIMVRTGTHWFRKNTKGTYEYALFRVYHGTWQYMAVQAKFYHGIIIISKLGSYYCRLFV